MAIWPCDEPRLTKHVSVVPMARRRGFVRGVHPDVKPDGEVGGSFFRTSGMKVSLSGSDGASAAPVVLDFQIGDEAVQVRWGLFGVHNADNALVALTVAKALDVPLHDAAAALADVRLPPHRSAVVTKPGRFAGRFFLDDCYNANPASMRAALDSLGLAAGDASKRYAVLGDMLELGEEAEVMHKELAQLAARHLEGLVAVGAFADSMIESAKAAGLAKVAAFGGTDDASLVGIAKTLETWTDPGDWVLLKGSRGVYLERVLDAG